MSSRPLGSSPFRSTQARPRLAAGSRRRTDKRRAVHGRRRRPWVMAVRPTPDGDRAKTQRRCHSEHGDRRLTAEIDAGAVLASKSCAALYDWLILMASGKPLVSRRSVAYMDGLEPSTAKASMAPAFPIARLRRLRRTEALRGLVRETAVTANDLIQPLFIEEGIDEALPIAEMPGVSRIPERKLEHVAEGLARDGVKSLMLFGISHHKDAFGQRRVESRRPGGADGAQGEAGGAGVGGDPGHLLLRIHRPRPLRRDRARARGERHHDREPGTSGGGGGGRGRRHDRAVSDDGRAGRGDPARAGCGGTSGRADHGVFDQVRFGVLWAVPRGGRAAN